MQPPLAFDIVVYCSNVVMYIVSYFLKLYILQTSQFPRFIMLLLAWYTPLVASQLDSLDSSVPYRIEEWKTVAQLWMLPTCFSLRSARWMSQQKINMNFTPLGLIVFSSLEHWLLKGNLIVLCSWNFCCKMSICWQ